jgi:hypothetical protein
MAKFLVSAAGHIEGQMLTIMVTVRTPREASGYWVFLCTHIRSGDIQRYATDLSQNLTRTIWTWDDRTHNDTVRLTIAWDLRYILLYVTASPK